jgi:hypothetical protein
MNRRVSRMRRSASAYTADASFTKICARSGAPLIRDLNKRHGGSREAVYLAVPGLQRTMSAARAVLRDTRCYWARRVHSALRPGHALLSWHCCGHARP